MTVAVTLVTLRPLLGRRSSEAMAAEADLNVYRDQLDEVDRDLERGLVNDTEAEAARTEISRRMLAADQAAQTARQVASDDPEPDTSGTARGQRAGLFQSLVFYLSAALIVVASAGFYLLQGAPGYGGRPHAERVAQAPGKAPVEELIARVEARLREEPRDGKGWDVLAPVYARLGRTEEAVRAYRQAIALLGENRARLRGLAEASLAASNGIVTEEARLAFKRILAKEPNLIAPRFWLAVAAEQDGDKDKAAEAYRGLLAEGRRSPEGGRQPLPAALTGLIRERLAAVTGEGASMATAPGVADGAGLPGGANGGAAPALGDNVAVPEEPSARAAMVEQMVGRLAERLKQKGGTVDEWQRLMRAYWVLGRRDDAREALADAKAAFAGKTEDLAKLETFARQLGLVAS